MRKIIAVGTVGVLLGGCGGGGGATSGGGGTSSASSSAATTAGAVTATSSGTGNACIPGKVDACPCPGGVGMGVQTCEQSGAGFGPCTGCEATSSSSSTGIGGGGGGGVGDPCVGYPVGPYGLSKGDTIANYNFDGFVDATKSTATVQNIQLCHFYNPTGTEVYFPGSQYGAGATKPKALLLAVGAVWNPPSNYEAKTELPMKYLKYKPSGGEFLSVLAHGTTAGIPATEQDLVNWSQKYKVNYPDGVDPTQSFTALMDYPAHWIVDLHTMKIVDTVVGVPESPFWDEFGGLLN
jgi:hypothetical protein